MKNRGLKSIVLATCLASATASHATELINFDNFVYTYNVNYSYYYFKESLTSFAGLDWINASALNPTNLASGAYQTSGAAAGIVSLPSVAINTDVGPLQFSSPNPFSLKSAYFAGVWNDDLNINVKALTDGIIVYSKTFTVDTKQSVLETFNWSGIESVLITATGGTNAGLNGSGAIFAMDNLILSAVPEPVSGSLMAAGLALIGLNTVRRRIGEVKSLVGGHRGPTPLWHSIATR